MFKRVELRNFRTHVNTSIDLQPITLLIGNNNSGKSNFLSGIKHFSHLIRRARPSTDSEDNDAKSHKTDKQNPKHLNHSDFFPFRYRLSGKNEPMGFSCEWWHKLGEINYSIDLFEAEILPDNVICAERITIQLHGKEPKKFTVDAQKKSTELRLRSNIENHDSFNEEEKQMVKSFFADFATCWTFHFQPSFLKRWPTERRAFMPNRLKIPSQLGFEGGGLQQTLADAERLDKRVLDRFIAGLRRFEPNFFGISVDRKRDLERIMWQFDLRSEGHEILDEFPPTAVSDGLLKAAAISLLTSVKHPPGLILLEEIENGINPGNIQEFLQWLWQSVGTSDSSPRGPKTQIILTSHSPSVLREFGDYLDYVYVMRLNRDRFKTITTNLGTALESLVAIGTVKGDIIEEEGESHVKIPRHQLTELWYSGSIG